MFLAVTDDKQAQQSRSGVFTHAQNILISGGTSIVSLCCSCDTDFSINSMARIFSLLIMVCRL